MTGENIDYQLFDSRGRVNRRPVVFAFLILLCVLTFGETLEPYAVDTVMFFWPVVFLVFLSNIVLVIKRCHDLGRPGYYALWLLVPLANLWAAYVLSFTPGQKGPNKYGEDPLGGRS